MPVYDYECPKCGAKREIFKNLAELDDEEFCECNDKYPMERRVGNAGGFRLKGDGWAEDGYDKYIGDIEKTRRRDGKLPLDHNTIHGTDYD